MSGGGDRRTRVLRRLGGRGVRIGVQLALLSGLVTATVIAATFAMLTVRTRATTRALITDEVGHGQQTLLALQQRRDRQFVAAAALMAVSPNLRSAIATTRVEGSLGGEPSALLQARRADVVRTVRRELERLAPDLGSDLVATTDEQGHVFAAVVDGDDLGRPRRMFKLGLHWHAERTDDSLGPP